MSNPRNILVSTNKFDVDELSTSDAKFVIYHPLSEEEIWKVNFIHEVVDIKNEQLEVNGFNQEELDEILDFVCCS